MKPADNGKRKYKCPFSFLDKNPSLACRGKGFKFSELVWHLREMHTEHQMMAWICAAIWEDVSGSMEERCE